MSATRRRFLQALGLGGASLLLPSLGRRGASPARAEGEYPTRLLIFTTQHGAPRQHWQMDLPGLPAAADGYVDLAPLAATDFSHVLAPLYDVRDRVTIVQGLSMMSSMLDDPGNNHGVSWAHLLTNAYANYDEPFQTSGGIHPVARGRSIDQYIAAQVSTAGMIPTLEWGGGGRFASGPVGYATGPDGSWLPYETDPARAFARLFPMGPPDPAMAAPSRRDLIRAARPSVLDAAAELYDTTIPRLAAEDRTKLEQHRDLIRDLEARLSGTATGGAACDPSYDDTASRYDQFFQLLSVAFSCDLTRVATIDVPQLSTSDFGAPPGDVHEVYAHGTSPEAYMAMADYYRYHANQFRSLVEHLDAIPEGSGTLLDNTVVLWFTELATGGHDMADTLAVVAGGGGGALSPGRYVRFAQNRPNPCSTYGCLGGGNIGPGHSHLFVNAMQAMGLSDDSYGIASASALDGSAIDLSGPLPFVS